MKLFHIALSLLVLTPVAAFAQETPTSVAVSYRDLNLKSEAGVKTLDRRLANAIRTVCGGSVCNSGRAIVLHNAHPAYHRHSAGY